MLQLKDAETTEQEFVEMVDEIVQLKCTEIVYTLVVKQTEKYFYDKIAPEFWSYYKNCESESRSFKNFCNSMNLLHDYFVKLYNVFLKIEVLQNKFESEKYPYGRSTATGMIKMMFRNSLRSQLPIEHTKTISVSYEIALKMTENKLSSVQQPCMVCTENSCSCLELFYNSNRYRIINLYFKLNARFYFSIAFELSLFEPMINQVFTLMIFDYIEQHIDKTCKDNFDVKYVDLLEKVSGLKEYL